MKQRSLFIFCLIIGMAGSAATQTVTNADLDKYRQARLRAERDYRENYAKMGFPSPEELDRQREKSRTDTEQLSAKLRAERLERERLEAYRRAELARSAQYAHQQQVLVEQYPQDYGYIYSYGRWYRQYRRHRAQPQGYFAGGQFWPPPVGTPRPSRPTTRWIRPPR